MLWVILIILFILWVSEHLACLNEVSFIYTMKSLNTILRTQIVVLVGGSDLVVIMYNV